MAKEKLIEKQPFEGKNAILCGASTGIGKACAKEFVQLGGNVVIIARRIEVLKQAIEEIQKLKSNSDQTVEYISCDTTDMDALKPLLEDYIKKNGVPDYLFNVVGIAIPGYIEEYTLDDFKKNMNINYYGQLVPILCLLPHFMEKKKGYIINFSSMMGYMGMMGYGAYCPTKFAIVGLSEVLRNELKPYGIKISIVYPPDTNTPGLSTENEGKPKECEMMSETGGLLEPEEVAEHIINKVLKNKFHISPGMSKPIRYINRLFPKLVRWFMDRDYKKARKKCKKKI
ncbi:MAG: SDR family NAD(P)-dependent oxidoreductase [Promethearchaeota archaeon]|nr:MAG: SDR family NAD(P)-dependent oxidoreductase [Candidatus Lokiarchaeota archaeon]